MASRSVRTSESPIHRCDPRIKVIVALALIIGIVSTPAGIWVAYILLWTLVNSLAAVGQIGVWRLNRRAGIALPFTLAAVTLLVTTPGDAVTTVAGMTVTDTGLARFFSIVLKSWLSMQVALVLSMTTPFIDIVGALRALGVSRTLVAIVTFMHRYLVTLKDEAARLLRARGARSGSMAGRKPGRTFWWRARIVGSMVGTLFVRSYERSERVYVAMLARGYNGEIQTQPMPRLQVSHVAIAAVPVGLVIVIQVIIRL